jgi:hypothetical protein
MLELQEQSTRDFARVVGLPIGRLDPKKQELTLLLR